MTRIFSKTALAAVLAAATLASPVMAKDNGHNNGTGWGVGQVPPGHQKKAAAAHHAGHAKGDHLTNYTVINNYANYGLSKPPRGYEYVLSDGNIYQIAIETATIAATVGLVSALLNAN
ncbi:hypothetical protein AQS8620_02129 [Aquimixticola soesokkakensis]|uniref:Nickel/cobalt homeostasis protein RcnB n=1 Tax=Aquimixticola soesokkakensis TaxID=1519096 RepID=A0A1Y5SVP9_9RHOB|nr:RcnB family protein [Aquimixticola soesokkakensis]SLN49687.1 hypothetical protein AQS8620_02129 [Aquimixticola soesokkakensis]